MAVPAPLDRHWLAPEGFREAQAAASPLPVLYNSLTDSKQTLVPAAGVHSRQLTWYSCGPTVYDAAHVGHARNYVSFDIVRRVLEDYFGYSITYVMNVTDVDDKIIRRARRTHLLEQYRAAAHDAAQVEADLTAALQSSRQAQQQKVADGEAALQKAQQGMQEAKVQGGKDVHKRERIIRDMQATLDGEKLRVDQLAAQQARLSQAGRDNGHQVSVSSLLKIAGDELAAQLEEAKGHSITDKEIYRQHAARYEAEFFEDMAALSCRPPDVLTRVSEYVPEIVGYVEQIVRNRMAYAANGSVYFDTAAFRQQGHVYGKLNPWAVGSALAAEDADCRAGSGEKRHATDFALWKAAKPGEPFWESPWGPGRPGWHIECSAMASAVIGARLDIHTGGEDLRFPHHDNELAQSEAYYHGCGCKQWVNYFLHAGHLSIEGLKMSKSLKNFVTIREALAGDFTPRQLRLMFALSPWERGMQYGSQLVEEMRAKEAALHNFFQNVDVVLRQAGMEGQPTRWKAEERSLRSALQHAQEAAHAALLDNINTAGALEAVAGLVRETNRYLSEREAGRGQALPTLRGDSRQQGQERRAGSPLSMKVRAAQAPGPPPQPLLLRAAAAWVTRLLVVFGISTAAPGQVGFGDAAGGAEGGGEQAAAVLDAFAGFRDQVRHLAKEHKDAAVLDVCDRARDETLADMGVRLEDRPGGRSVWKRDDPAVLRREREEKQAAARAARRKKLQREVADRQKELTDLQAARQLPSLQEELRDKFSMYDVNMQPTHDLHGVELDDKARKAAKKVVDKRLKVRAPLEKLRARYLDPDAQQQQEQQLRALQQELATLSVDAAPNGSS